MRTTTTTLLTSLALLSVGAAAPAQDTDLAALTERRAAKLHAPFLLNADWTTDWDDALAVAKETGKPIFAYFSRSYAPCAPCAALESGALSVEAFKAFSQDVIPYLHVTSHLPDEPHPDQMREKGGTGFPHVAFLDADGNVIALEAGRTVDAFTTTLHGAVDAYLGLVARAAAGDATAQRELFARRVELGQFEDVEAARARFAEFELDDPVRARLERALVDQEFNRILSTVHGEADAGAAGARAVPMYRKGRIPTTGTLPMYYWLFLGQHAAEARDAELLTAAIDALQALPRVPSAYLDKLRKAKAALAGK